MGSTGDQRTRVMLSVGRFSSSISVKETRKYSDTNSQARQERAFRVGHRGGVQVWRFDVRLSSTTSISRAITFVYTLFQSVSRRLEGLELIRNTMKYALTT